MSSHFSQKLTVEPTFAASPADWLADQARKYNLRYLLAHADDGVIWGRIDDAGLRTWHDTALQSPQLRAATLQQCRLFGPTAELLMWRDGAGRNARLISDTGTNPDEWIDEDHILWGSDIERIEDGFTLVRDGAQGMRHAVPIELTDKQLKGHQLRLRTRHYVVYNDDGEASIGLSRLVQLLPEAA